MHLRISLGSGVGEFEADDEGHDEDGDDEEAHALPGAGAFGLFVGALEVLDSLVDVEVGLLDVVVDAVDEGALLDDQLVELLVDAVELVDGLDQLGDLLVLLDVVADLSLANLHVLELVLHPLPVLLVQLDRQVRSPRLVRPQPVVVLLLLGPQRPARLPHLQGQRLLHVAVDLLRTGVHLCSVSVAPLRWRMWMRIFSLLRRCLLGLGVPRRPCASAC